MINISINIEKTSELAKKRIMNLLAPVSTIMQTDLITLRETDTIAKAADIFKSNRIHHILVAEEEKLIGIISKSDFLFFQRGFAESNQDRLVEEIRMHHYHVSKIMTTGIAKLEPTDKINVAMEIFKENLFHAIPVVLDEKLVGIITTYDILSNVGKDKNVINEYELS